jgi:tRNA G37 N-methylase Trm5
VDCAFFTQKNKNISTVVNKIDSIDTTFRFFKMEVLAGEDNMIAEVVKIKMLDLTSK